MRVVEPVNSSVIEQIAYDTFTRVCVVTINGNDYVYYKIPFRSTIYGQGFRDFYLAESKGQFFNMYVKGRW